MRLPSTFIVVLAAAAITVPAIAASADPSGPGTSPNALPSGGASASPSVSPSAVPGLMPSASASASASARPSGSPSRGPGRPGHGHGTHPHGALSAQDRTFLAAAGHGAQFEITGGKLAQARAVDARVRTFGTRMVADHGKEGADLSQLVSRMGLTPQATPDTDESAIISIWSKLAGGDFDCSYAPTEYTEHEADLAAFQNEADHGSNPQVRDFARAQLPTLREHLRLAAAALSGLSCGR